MLCKIDDQTTVALRKIKQNFYFRHTKSLKRPSSQVEKVRSSPPQVAAHQRKERMADKQYWLWCLCMLSLAASLALATPSPERRIFRRRQDEFNGDIPGTLSEQRDLQNAASRFSCPENIPQAFDSILLISHLGDPDDLNNLASDVLIIQSAILVAYNEIAGAQCDPQFRNLTRVTADTDSIERVPETGTTNTTDEAAFAVRYTVSGYCDGCLNNTRGALFGGPTGVTSTSSSSGTSAGSSGSSSGSSPRSGSSSHSKTSSRSKSKSRSRSKSNRRSMSKSKSARRTRGLQKTCSNCRGTEGGPQPSPWKRQINEQLSLVQRQLSGDSNYTVVRELLEARAVVCTADTSDFSNTYLAVLGGEPAALTDVEEQALETAFAHTYNRVAFDQCDDPHHRRLNSVSLNPLGAKASPTTPFDASKVVQISTEATCHNCTSDSLSIFRCNANSQRLLQEKSLLSYVAVKSPTQPPQAEKALQSYVAVKSPTQPPQADNSMDSSQLSSQTRQADSGTCFCSAKNIDATGSPSFDVFRNEYNKLLEIGDVLESTSFMEDAVEVEMVACSETEGILETTVFLSLDGRIETLDEEFRIALASGFQRVYNEMLFAVCDLPFFRRAETVEISSSNSWLGRQPFPVTRLDREYLLKVSVGYGCRDCSANATMFDQGETGPFMTTPFQSGGFNQDIQTGTGNICYCPLEGSISATNNATVTLFQDYYNAFLEGLDLSGVETVDEIEELESFACGTNVSRRATTLWVEFSDDPYNTTLEERRVVEEEMRHAYNNLNFKQHCDSAHFRTVSSVTLIGDSRRRLSVNPDRRKLAGLNLENLAKMQVIYECRECLTTSVPLLSWTTKAPLEPVALNFSEVNGNVIQAANLSDTCYCALSDRAEDRSPTEEEFRHSYSISFGSLKFNDIPMEHQRTNSNSTSRLTANDLVEVYDQSCPAQKYAFQTEVYLRLQNNVTTLSVDEQDRIIASFTEAYNNLNFMFCDSINWRRILAVELDLPFVRRREQEDEFEEFGQAEGDENLVRLLVDVECRDCTTETTMFSSSSLANNESSIELPSVTSMPLLSLLANRETFDDSANECYCSSTFPFQGRAPTASEFRTVLDDGILELEEIGNADDLEIIKEVIEVKSVECSEEVSQFTATVFVGLQGDLTRVTDDEKRVLETTFQDQYNEISFSRCDSFFRQLLDVTLVPASVQTGDARRLEDAQGNSTKTKQATLPLFVDNVTSTEVASEDDLALYRVIGECRDCPVTDSGTFALFDDSFRRALTEQEVFVSAGGNTQMRRQLQRQASGCLCPINTVPEPAAISTAEFLVEYDNTVTRLGQTGTLVNVAGVSDIESCDSAVTEVSGVYEIFFSGDTGELSDEEQEALIVDAFNSLRTDVCSAQVVEVDVVSDTSTALRAEVIAVSSEGPQEAVFSDDSADTALFLNGLNILISSSGGTATASNVAFYGPAARCSPNRNTYKVELIMEYTVSGSCVILCFLLLFFGASHSHNFSAIIVE